MQSYDCWITELKILQTVKKIQATLQKPPPN